MIYPVKFIGQSKSDVHIYDAHQVQLNRLRMAYDLEAGDLVI